MWRRGDTLTTHIDRFMTEDDAWWDDVLIAEMIELAKRTGNIQRNPVKLGSKIYTQGNYFTDHLGGVCAVPVCGSTDRDYAENNGRFRQSRRQTSADTG